MTILQLASSCPSIIDCSIADVSANLPTLSENGGALEGCDDMNGNISNASNKND
jgi:hypothetical protein